MKNKNVNDYDIYRTMGQGRAAAALAANISRPTSYALEAAKEGRANMRIIATAGMVNSPFDPVAVNEVAEANGIDMEQWRLAAEFPVGVGPVDEPWWKDALGIALEAGQKTGLFAAAELLGTGQQAMLQWLSRGDARRAVPEWLAPDDWKQKGINHEIIGFRSYFDYLSEGRYSEFLGRASANDSDTIEGAIDRGAAKTLKALEWVPDILVDPANLLAGSGIVSKGVRGLRRLAPVAVQAEQAAKLAGKSRFLGDIDEAIKLHKKWIKELAEKTKAAPTEENARKLVKASMQYRALQADKRYYLDKALPTMELVPSARPEHLIKPAKDASNLEKARYAAREEALKEFEPLVRFEDMDAETIATRMAFGPDDAEFAGESLRRVVMGANPDTDVLVRNLFDDVMPTTTSLELRPRGIGKGGMITREIAESKELLGNIENFVAESKGSIANTKKAIANTRKLKGMPAAEKASKIAGMEQDIARAEKRLKVAEEQLAHFGQYGTFSWAAARDLGFKLPGGPRRNVLRAQEFLDGAGQKLGAAMFTPMAYPGSVMPHINFGLGSYIFREPMRFFENRLPGAWEIISGGQKQKQAFVNGTSGKLRRIYEEAGIVGGAKTAKTLKTAGISLPTKLYVNSERSEILFDLLDTVKGTPEFEKLWTKADEKLQKAYTEMRTITEDFANKMGLNPEERISAYMPHIVPEEMFKGGTLPPEFYGAKINKTPWFLKERTGNNIYTKDIVEVFDLYTRGVSKHLYTNPSVDALVKLAQNSGDKWNVKYAEKVAGNLLGKPTLLGSMLRDLPLDGLHDRAKFLAAVVGSLSYAGALAGNIRYQIMSLVQAINTTGAEFGMMRTLKGLAKTATPEGWAFIKSVGLADEHAKIFEEMKTIVNKTASEIRPLAPSITDVEASIRGITFFASLDENLTKFGYKALSDVTDAAVSREIVARAVRDAESINHVFGMLGRPAWMGRVSQSGSALATQFFSFPFKQTETIVNASMKNPGFFADYMILAGQMQNIAGKFNVDITPFVGTGYTDFASRDLYSMPVDLMKSFAEAMQKQFDSTSPDDVKREYWDTFRQNAKMFVPGRIGWKQRKEIGRELTSGVKRKWRTGELERKLNFSGEKDPVYNKGNEYLSVLTRLDSYQQRMYRDTESAKRKAEGKRAVTSSKIALEINRAFREGKPIDTEKLTLLRQELSRLGIKMSDTDLSRALQDEFTAHNIEARLREENQFRQNAGIRASKSHILR